MEPTTELSSVQSAGIVLGIDFWFWRWRSQVFGLTFRCVLSILGCLELSSSAVYYVTGCVHAHMGIECRGVRHVHNEFVMPCMPIMHLFPLLCVRTQFSNSLAACSPSRRMRVLMCASPHVCVSTCVRVHMCACPGVCVSVILLAMFLLK